jgi:hypothetical protein
MPKVRGKFKVTEITRSHHNPAAAKIKLEAVYSNSPEDNSYSAATPNGTIQMYLNNPAAIDDLPLGKSFYVDFTPIEE